MLDISGGAIFSPSRQSVAVKLSTSGWLDTSLLSRQRLKRYTPDTIFCALIQPSYYRALKFLLPYRKKHKLVLYLVDTWEHQLDAFDELIAECQPDLLFIAYRQSIPHFESKWDIPVEWLPLAVDTDVFRDWGEEKEFDVYAMGRRYEPHHNILKQLDSENKIRYLYNEKGKNCSVPIAREPQDLSRLINKCRYFLVSPQDIMTQSQEAYDKSISPIVPRYFEGIASGTMLLGVRPHSGELEDLFPFDDVMADVELDGSNLLECILRYKYDAELYKKIVDRNYKHLQEHHSYRHRAEQVLSIINQLA